MTREEAIKICERELFCSTHAECQHEECPWNENCPNDAPFDSEIQEAFQMAIEALSAQHWIPCSERLPSEEERKEWIAKNLGGIGYLYPCLVTRYSSINPDREKNNPYVAKHYYDGEDFVNNGEEVCSEYVVAWMPLPEPWKGDEE